MGKYGQIPDPTMRSSFLLAVLLAAVPAMGTLPDGYERIVLSRQTTEAVETAAGQLANLLEETYGERPQLRRATLSGGPRGIHIGPGLQHPAFDDDPLTDEVVVERTARGLEIHGSDNSSTITAVFRFEEYFLGWRYFQPGELGLERLDNPPQPTDLEGPHEVLLVEKAAFLSRNPFFKRSFANGPDWRLWHGLRERFGFNHSLHKVVPPDQFEDHPEWFAKNRSGQPVPQPYPYPHGYNHHPDLSHPGLRQQVAGQTLAATVHSAAKHK